MISLWHHEWREEKVIINNIAEVWTDNLLTILVFLEEDLYLLNCITLIVEAQKLMKQNIYFM